MQLQALSLPPPSLDLPLSATSTPLAEYHRCKGKSTETLPSSAASESTTIFSPEFVASRTEAEDEDSPPVASTSEEPTDSLLPPDNFAMVCPDIYRSSFPSKKHYPFLQSLGLRTVLTLVQDDYPKENADFFASEGINLVQIGIPGNKEPFVTIPDEKIRDALSIVLDKRNHPLFIHCNKGKVSSFWLLHLVQSADWCMMAASDWMFSGLLTKDAMLVQYRHLRGVSKVQLSEIQSDGSAVH